jgi:hypothetical protein
VSLEKPFSLTAGPLLTGKEVEPKKISSLSHRPSLTFELPPTKKLPFWFDFKGEDIKPGMFLSWKKAPERHLSVRIDHDGGQFMPLVSSRFEIGGFTVGCKVKFTVTMPHRVVRKTSTHVGEANNLLILKPGDRLSRLKLQVRDKEGQLYQSGLFGVRIRIPRAGAKLDEAPQDVIKVPILSEDGTMNKEVDLSKGATAEIFVRPRYAGYFGPAQKNLRVLTVSATKPDSVVDLGITRVTVPGHRFEGVVVDEDGKPLAHARVTLLTRIQYKNKKVAPTPWNRESRSSGFVKTDAEGRFRLIAGTYYPRQLDFAIRAKLDGKISEPLQVKTSQGDLRIVL